MLNRASNTAQLAEEFQLDERVRMRMRMQNILDLAVAEQIREYCLNKVPQEFVHFREGKNQSWCGSYVNGKTQADMRQVQTDIWHEARTGAGFQYSGYMMRKAGKGSSDEKLRFLMHMIADLGLKKYIIGRAA